MNFILSSPVLLILISGIVMLAATDIIAHLTDAYQVPEHWKFAVIGMVGFLIGAGIMSHIYLHHLDAVS